MQWIHYTNIHNCKTVHTYTCTCNCNEVTHGTMYMVHTSKNSSKCLCSSSGLTTGWPPGFWVWLLGFWYIFCSRMVWGMGSGEQKQKMNKSHKFNERVAQHTYIHRTDNRLFASSTTTRCSYIVQGALQMGDSPSTFKICSYMYLHMWHGVVTAMQGFPTH